MTKRRLILWSPQGAYSGNRFDGCTTRRRAIRSVLSQEPLQVLHLESRGGLYDGTAQLLRLLHFLSKVEAHEQLIFFYPDFPLFHPPRQLKVPLLRLILKRIKTLKERLNVQFVVDVVDLPRWQAPCLGYELRMAEGPLRAAEKEIFSLADRVILPTESLANLLVEDLSLGADKLAILPNGLPHCLAKVCKDVRGEPAYFYAGDLSLSRNRRVKELIGTFLANAPEEAVLHLCGAEGEWIVSEEYGATVFYHGHLSEEECLRLASQCDFGLIPYPESDYFQWCFPSKVGLYLAAALPILASQLLETGKVLKELAAGECKKLVSFGEFFSQGKELSSSFDRNELRKRVTDWNWSGQVRSAFSVCPAESEVH